MHHTPSGGCDDRPPTPLPIRPGAAIAMLVGLVLVLALDSGLNRVANAGAAYVGLLNGIGPLW